MANNDKFDISCEQAGGPFTIAIENALAALDQHFTNSVDANTQTPLDPSIEHGINLPGRIWFDKTNAEAVLKIYTASDWVTIAERITNAEGVIEMVATRAAKADALSAYQTVSIVTVPGETTYASGSFEYDGSANSSLALKVEKSIALKTARAFSISGDVTTATAVDFNGTGNVDISVKVDKLGTNGRGTRHVTNTVPDSSNWSTEPDSNFDIYYVY